MYNGTLLKKIGNFKASFKIIKKDKFQRNKKYIEQNFCGKKTQSKSKSKTIIKFVES